MPSPNDITKFMRADAVRHVRRTSRLYWRADAPDYATIDGPRRKPKLVYLGGKFRTQAAAVEAVVRFWTGERDLAAFVVEREVDGKAMFVPSVGQYRVEPWGGYTLSLAAESRPAAELVARALLLALYSVNRKIPSVWERAA